MPDDLSGGTAVANGVVFNTSCVAWVRPDPDYPADCSQERLAAFSASTGCAASPCPIWCPGGPIVAAGRLYVWTGREVWMYQPS